jgi:hypothetical protein
MLRRRVIERQFFAFGDVAQRKEKKTTMTDAAEAVWLARMINVGRRVSTTTCINTPIIVHLTDSDLATARDSAPRLRIRDPFPEEFPHLLAAGQGTRSKTTLPIDARVPHQ